MGRGRRQQRAGGTPSPQHCPPELQPAALSSSGRQQQQPRPRSSPRGRTALLPRGLGRWGIRVSNARPFLTETLQVTRDVMESRAKSPQPAGRATCGGEGEPRPRGAPPAGDGGKGNGAAREGGSRDGLREQGRAEAAALQRQGGRERRTYLRPDGRHAAGGAERRGGLRPPLFISPGRRAAPPPATPAGPGRPPGPPAAESAARPRRAEPGWAGPNRTEPSGAGLLPHGPAPRGGSAALARSTDSPRPL